MSDPYTVSETLSETGTFSLHRAIRQTDNVPVLIKLEKADTSGSRGRTRLRHEYEIGQQLDSSYLLKPRELDLQEEQARLVLEDFDGKPLSDQLGQALGIGRFLDIALQLAAALADIHRQEFVHKDLKPANILFNPQTKAIKLTGFGIAAPLVHAPTMSTSMGLIEGSLAYMSPEQTGRMNRGVDHRSDLYSLGVTFYQMLTGKLPFQANDQLEWVHCHIARTPTAPHMLLPGIPEMISLIVMKLMSKMADDRYQSAVGLKADLEKCLRGLTAAEGIQHFQLGAEDSPSQLRFGRKLYGREDEIERLLGAFARVIDGIPELLLVAGYAGIGKTALVREIYPRVLERHGHFVEGKSEQLQPNVPYSVWIQALKGLVNELLMESEAELNQWKQTIQRSAGDVGRVLTDVIPDLKLIIGPQPEVPALGPAETQNRFNYVFLEFIKAIAKKERPLVVFLDDMQWIDSASLNLLRLLLNNAEVSHLLVIGTYRDNEVDAVHPLTLALEAMRKEAVAISLLQLGNIREEGVNKLLADTLGCELSHAAPLTGLIYQKTSGNPFFLLQTLATLEEKKAIFFDAEQRSWKWDISILREQDITDNVVALMLGKIGHLPSETKRLLSLAACMGFSFDSHRLAIISEQPEDVILKHLLPAQRESLITASNAVLHFSHDRIQQAAYSLIPDAEKKPVHLEIGRLLLENADLKVSDEHIFDIVNHLNIGSDLLETSKKALELAELNCQAGRKAKARSAFSAALEYFETGLGLLGEDSWASHYALTLTLYQEATEASCLCGNYQRMSALASTTHKQVASILDAAPTYRTEIRALTAQGQLIPAVHYGLKALQDLGMKLPKDPTATEVEEYMQRTLLLLQRQTIKGISDLPPMMSQEQLVRFSILSELGEPAYAVSPHFFLVWASSMAALSLGYGNCDLSPFAYAAYALALCATGVHIEAGSELAKFAISMIDELGAQSQRCRILNIYGCIIQPWTEHLRETLATLNSAASAGAGSGDFTSGSYAAFNSCTAAFYMGERLADVTHRMVANLGVISGLRQGYIWNWVAFLLLGVRRLRGVSELPQEIGSFNETDWLASAREANDQCGLAYYHLGKLIEAYLLANSGPDTLNALIDEVDANIAGFQGAFAVPVFHFYSSLALLRLGSFDKDLESSSRRERVCGNLERLQGLSRSAAMNLQHKCDLVAAELARSEGREWQAVKLYEKAIVGARTNGFVQEMALSYELAARFYIEQGMEDAARIHMIEAHHGYTRWQAWAKARALEAEYPHWLKAEDTLPSELSVQTLDLATVMKAAQAITSKIELDTLLGEVMRIVIENAGAQRGCLLMERDDSWVVVVEGETEETKVRISRSTGFEERKDAVSARIVHFVAHTKEAVVLDDAQHNGEFLGDPYILRRHTKSLVCAPLLSADRLIGIMYLENNLTTHAFPPERIRLLEMLLSQVAISLENARIYKALRDSEQKFHAIFHQTFQFIGLLTTDGILLEANNAALQFAGIEEDAVVGKPFWETPWWTHSLEMQQRLREAVQEASKGNLVRFETTHRDQSGRLHYIDFSLKPITDASGSVTRIIPEGRDITDRKRAEEEIRTLNQELEQRVLYRTGQLEAVNKELESFAYSVSHDLRAPLRHINGFVELLASAYRDKLDLKGIHYIDTIAESARRMGTLIDDLLQFSRTGRMEMQERSINMNQAIHEVVAQFKENDKDRDIEWIIEDLPPARGDDALVRQVWANLIENAIKYTRPRERARIEIRGQRGERDIIYSVCDNGVGFDMKYAGRLFGVFQRLHSSDEFEGTGIGLATVSRIIARHGGRVWAESKPGEGAKFYFTLQAFAQSAEMEGEARS